MSVRDGTLRQRLLAGAMLCVAAAVPAVARAQQAPAGKKPAQAQHAASVPAQKAAAGKSAAPASIPPVVAQRPGATAARKAAVAQQPAAASQKPVSGQKAAPAVAQKPAVAQNPAGAQAQKAGATQKAAAAPRKPAPRAVVAQKDSAGAQKPGKKSGRAAAAKGKRGVGHRSGGDAAERAVAASPAPDTPEPTETTHVVKPGDTLWDLSTTYLGSPWAWARVYNANRGSVQYPHWIYPGQKLNIPGKELLAKLEQEEAEASRDGDRTIFYRKPEGDANGSVGVDLRPSVELGEYLATPWLDDMASLGVVGRLLDRVKVEGTAEKLAQAVVIQNRIYLRPNAGTAPPAAGSQLMLVRVERALPPFGSIIEPTAQVLVESANDDVAIARIVKQFAPILQGERAVPVPAFTPPHVGQTQPVQRGPEGELIAFLREQPLHTIADLAFVSIGKAEGLAVGDELVAYAPTRPAAADPTVQLPPEDVARLRVVRVEEHTATVRPLSLRLPSLQRGLKVRLVARVP